MYFTGDYAYTAQSANYTGVTPNNGTPLTAGLNKGIDQFKDSDATNRVIILVADGETSDTDFWGNTVYPTNAANRFKNGDGTIYTVGFTFSSKGFHSLSSGKDYQKNANNAGALNGALTEIREKIVGMISDPMGEMVTLDKSSVNVDKTASTATTTTTDTKIEWTDTAGLDGTVTLTYDVSLKPEVTERAGVKTIDLNGNATFNYSYKQGNTTVSKSLSFPQPTATVYVASLDVKYRLESETGTEVNVVATSDISGTSHEVKQLPYTFEAKLPAVGDTVTANGKTYYVKSVTGATDKANTPLEATVANADAHTITVTLTDEAPTATYKVEHYKQNVDGTFPKIADETEENLTGSTGTTATATPKTYPGFTCDESVEGTIKSGTIAADGSLVLKLYYTRNTYTVTFKDGANEAVFKDETQQVEYGKAVPSHADPVRPGYNFTGWTSEPANYQPGTGTMPANNITFTAQWTEKGSVTINYVAKTGGSVTPTSEALNPDTGEATGSTAKANDGYRFVGWYSDETCTTAVPAAWVDSDNKLTPGKPEGGWADATYYAKFEAIPTPGADDLPKVAVICTNDVMGHDASNTELTGSTYTVGRTQYENGVYTCKVTLNQTQGHIDTYNASNPGHTDDATNANVEEITLTYDAAQQTWTKSADTFKIYVVCNTTKFDVTYNWTGLDGATFESAVKPELPLKAKVTKGGKHTVDTGYKAGDIRVATNGDKYRFSGWSTTDASIVSGEITNIQNNIALIGEWTKLGSGTFDLNDKIFKVFDKADGSRDIPSGNYTFKATVTRLDKETNGLTDEKYTGTVTLDGATAAATPSFVFNDPITFHTGDEYRFLVEEKSNTVTALSSDERIDYDNAEYYLYVTVSDDLKTINYRFEHVLVITSAEEEPAATENQPITFHNYYYAAKDPGKYTIDFSTLIFKVLTKTGDRSFNGAEFTATVDGWKVNQYDVMSARVIKTHFVDLQPVTLKATFPADTTFDADGKAYRAFTGDKLTVTEGEYLFLIDEINDGQTNITYDENKYWLNLGFVENAEGEVSLAGQRVRKFVDGDTYETVLALEDSEWMIVDTSISPVYFENTIDTGKDDYYPIIIPTIINKDTGMLNKTDHFAYVIGYPDGTVHPNGQITRAEVATIFFRLLRDEVRDGAFTTSNSYSDVAYGKWYNNPISTMSALGIITGYPDGTFKPNKPITRAEFAAIAARFDETQSGKSATFSDVIGHWAAKEIGIAYYNDWIKGYPDGTFKPDQNITRAEAMTVINRVLERKPESPADLLTNMNKWTDNLDTSKWYYLDVQEATNSHGYTRKTFNYELWRQMLPDPDWSRYER